MFGFSLLEVMISLFLITLSLIFLIKEEMHLGAMIDHTYFQTIALSQALEIRGRLRANESSDYQSREIVEWNLENAQLLPKGVGEVHCDQKHYFVSINWEEQTLQHLKLKLTR